MIGKNVARPAKRPLSGKGAGSETSKIAAPSDVSRAVSGFRRASVARNVLAGIDLVLAPLCGITDAIFRRICLRHGADLVVTEMVSSDGLTRSQEPLRAMRSLDTGEGPLAIQILGGDPERMGQAAEFLSALHPHLIDLNFGCPVRKVIKGNGGAAVLRDLRLLGRVCQTVVRKSRVPVSAKIRTGWDMSTAARVGDIARVIEDAGVSAITVHARTQAQGYRGIADWGLIAAVKRAVSIPVIGNGDVRSADDYFTMRERTGCDAVMIGRAAIGNPWIFTEIKLREKGERFSSPQAPERIGVLRGHLRDSVKNLGEPLGIISTRRVIATYLKDLPRARELRRSVMRLERLSQIEKALDEYVEMTAA